MKWFLIILTLLIIIAAILVVAIPAKASLDDLVVVDSPLYNDQSTQQPANAKLLSIPVVFK